MPGVGHAQSTTFERAALTHASAQRSQDHGTATLTWARGLSSAGPRLQQLPAPDVSEETVSDNYASTDVLYSQNFSPF